MTPSAADNDCSDLSEFCNSRSDSAFTSLVRRHLPMVYHAALRRLGVPALAEEAAQNAFARLAVKAADVARHPERLRAWLHRTAFLEACTLARKELRLSRLPSAPEPVSPMPMKRPEMYDRLDEALNSLPELDRELLLRRCCEGEDFRHIAAAVGKSEAACQKRVERALHRLGRTLGGAGAGGLAAMAAAALAGIAGPEAKAAALPSVSRVAAAALRKQAAANAAGSWAGLAAGGVRIASMAACLAGGIVGWKQASAALMLSPATSRESESRRLSMPPSAAPVRAAPGRQAQGNRRDRSLDDVLESIQAGRLGPLIDFLPTATPADLRAVMLEDNRVYLSEGSPPPGAARQIALRHWAAIDPQGAFAWAQERDGLTSGLTLPDSALTLSVWMRADPAGAVAAFAAVPPPDRSPIAAGMVECDDEMAGKLLEAHPEVFKAVSSARSYTTQWLNPAPPDEKQEKIIAGVLSGTLETGVAEADILTAFSRAVFRDSDLHLDPVHRIPDPARKAQVLEGLIGIYGASLPVSRLEEMKSGLPPSLTRSRLSALLGRKLAAVNPAEAFRRLENAPPGAERDVFYHQAASVLADVDPWRLLEVTASLKGPIRSTGRALSENTRGANGPNHANWFSGLAADNTLGRLLVFAGADDPVRALALLPRIAEKQTGHWNLMPVHDMVMHVLSGWVDYDAPGAIRWAAASGTMKIRNDLGMVLYKGVDQTGELTAMLGGATEAERQLAQRGLEAQVAGAAEEGTAAELLSMMPVRDADEITGRLAGWAAARGEFAAALRLADYLSSEIRLSQALPDIARNWLEKDRAAALDWLRALPLAERRAVVESPAGAVLTEEQHQSLQSSAP